MSLPFELIRKVPPDEYRALLHAVYPHRTHDFKHLTAALARTLNLGATQGGHLVGVVRVLTDGYHYSTIPELIVHPDRRHQGIGRFLLRGARELAFGGLYFVTPPEHEVFFEKCGFRNKILAYTA